MPPGVHSGTEGRHSFSEREILRRGGERVQTEEAAARAREALLEAVRRRRHLAEWRPGGLAAGGRAASEVRTRGAPPDEGKERREAEATGRPPLAPIAELRWGQGTHRPCPRGSETGSHGAETAGSHRRRGVAEALRRSQDAGDEYCRYLAALAVYHRCFARRLLERWCAT